jgi:hypothetical protein
MISDAYLNEIRARLEGIGHLDVSIVGAPDAARLCVQSKSLGGELRVTREAEPASLHDVKFISHAFSDIPRLLDALAGLVLSAETVAAIDARVRAASPAPWTAFIQSDGGSGGADVIRVSENDNEADMYLWIGPDLAPSAIFRFVAEARQDVPALLAAARL